MCVIVADVHVSQRITTYLVVRSLGERDISWRLKKGVVGGLVGSRCFVAGNWIRVAACRGEGLASELPALELVLTALRMHKFSGGSPLSPCCLASLSTSCPPPAPRPIQSPHKQSKPSPAASSAPFQATVCLFLLETSRLSSPSYQQSGAESLRNVHTLRHDWGFSFSLVGWIMIRLG